MATVATRDERSKFLATALATRGERRVALTIAAAALLLFGAVVPFARVPLPPWPAFIPSYEAVLFFIDALTAFLLFDQFVRVRSAGVLALACGYLFDALMIVPHALSFPGAFTATGLLGAGPQTTAWLYMFWHGGFSLFVLGYAVLRRREEKSPPLRLASGGLIIGAVAGVALLAGALTLLTTWGHDWLPAIMDGSNYSMAVTKGVSPAVWALTLVAMLALLRPNPRVMDLWLMVVMWIWLFDIALAAVIGSQRFDLGFYAGRIFGLVAAGFLLATLVIEMTRLHATAVGAAASAEARLAQLERLRAKPEPAPVRGERTSLFIRRQNIAHYRTLLQQTSLDDAQRRSIEQLLDEEERKARSEEQQGGADRESA